MRTTRTDFALVFLAGCAVASSFLTEKEPARVVSIEQSDGITQDYWVKSGSRREAEIQKRIDDYGMISIDEPVGVNRWIEEVSRYYASSNLETGSEPDRKQLDDNKSGEEATLKQVGFIKPSDPSPPSSIQKAGIEPIASGSDFYRSDAFSAKSLSEVWSERAARASRRNESLQRSAKERASQVVTVPVQWGQTLPPTLSGSRMLFTIGVGCVLAIIAAIWKRIAPTLVLDPHLDASTRVNETSDFQLMNPEHQRVLPLHLKPEWVRLVQPFSVRIRRCFTAILILSGLFASIFA